LGWEPENKRVGEAGSSRRFGRLRVSANNGTFIDILHEKPRMALHGVRRAMGQLNEGETGGKNEIAA